MIIDIHSHLPADGSDSLPAMRDECRRNGIGRILVTALGRGWVDYPGSRLVRAANMQARAFAERSEGLAKWLVYLNPQNADWRDELNRAAAGGPVGVKLLVSLKDSRGSLRNSLAVIRAAAEKRLPVLIHTFHRVGSKPGEITLAEFAALADACPSARMVAAHAGGRWREVLGILRGRAPNACVDISGSPPQQGMVEALVEDLGADRILFGSDFPCRSPASQIAKVLFAAILPRAKERIFYRNALSVFGPAVAPEVTLPPLPLRPASRLPDMRQDHFCFCGRWPFFETPCPTPAALGRLLAAQRVDRAYIADLGSAYRLDLERANADFLRAARRVRRIAALATLNPRANNWRQVIDGAGPAAGAIVYPYLHDWVLDDPAHVLFFVHCAEKHLPLWINCRLGDDRFRHFGLACRPVAVEELVRFVKRAPENSYVFQGLTAPEINELLVEMPRAARVRFEISRLTDHPGALDKVVAAHGLSRLVMGCEFPLRDIRAVRWAAERQ
jgi:hypothetical protein